MDIVKAIKVIERNEGIDQSPAGAGGRAFDVVLRVPHSLRCLQRVRGFADVAGRRTGTKIPG